MTNIEAFFNALREREDRTFSRREWMKLSSSVAGTKEKAAYLRGYLQEQGLIEYVVRVTEKGKARIKE